MLKYTKKDFVRIHVYCSSFSRTQFIMATCMINLDSAASYTFQRFCGEVMNLKPEHKASLAGTNFICFQLVKIECMTLDCLVAASLFGSDSLEEQTLKCLNGDVLTYTCIYITFHCSGHAFWIHPQVFITGTKLVLMAVILNNSEASGPLTNGMGHL